MKNAILRSEVAVFGGVMLLAAQLTAASDLSWSDPVGAPNEGWYASSWYGSFYNDEALGQWIWHASHGWEYIYPESASDAVWLWDCDAACWLYTAKDVYPYEYDYSRNAWFYFVDGKIPERRFWDFESNMYVPAGMLSPKINTDVTDATLGAGGSFNLIEPPTATRSHYSNFVVGNTTNDNVLVVQRGTKLSVFGLFIIGDMSGASSDNRVVLTGENTELYCSTLFFGTGGGNNTLHVREGALLKTQSFSWAGSATGGIVIDGTGFVAVLGLNEADLAGLAQMGLFTIGDRFDCLTRPTGLGSTGSFLVKYYTTDDEAMTATGHDGLGGYTVLSPSSEQP